MIKPEIAAPAPYRTTPVFDQDSLPQALRREHSTKAGVWGIVRLIEGRLRLDYGDGSPSCILSPDRPGLILPEQPHHVTPLGAMRMQVEFFDSPPVLDRSSQSLRWRSG